MNKEFVPLVLDGSKYDVPNKIKPVVLARLRSIEIASELPLEIPTFVEIGTFLAKGSYHVVTALNDLGRNSRFFSVDLNQSVVNFQSRRDEGWKPGDKYAERMGGVTGPCTHKFVEGSSHDVHTMFGDLAWCFIDGCHCFECCAKDMELYLPKIVSGGILLIDDTVENRFAEETSQWYHDTKNPRKYGVVKAIRSSEMLQNEFELICNITSYRGMMIWRKK